MLPNETLATTNFAIAIGIILDDKIGFVAIIFPKKPYQPMQNWNKKKNGVI